MTLGNAWTGTMEDVAAVGAIRAGVRRHRPADARGGRVVFVSHCLLNENVRYPGGATRPGAVDEVVDLIQAAGVGICQMACPEQEVWGGVRKRRMLLAYGADRRGLGLVRRVLTPIFIAYTRWRYDRSAGRVVSQVRDYRRAGYQVVGIVGVDGSPSCGVSRTLDLRGAVDALAGCDPRITDAATFNDRVVISNLHPGEGLFTTAVRRRLRRMGMSVPWFAHDLPGELLGRHRLPLGFRRALPDRPLHREVATPERDDGRGPGGHPDTPEQQRMTERVLTGAQERLQIEVVEQ